VSAATGLPYALGASLVLHATGIMALAQLPVGWQAGEPPAPPFAPALRATLRATASESTPVVAQLDAVTAVPVRERKKPAPPPEGILPPASYYPAHLLDERPQVRTHIEPAFPAAAPVDSGRVTLRLYIGEDGRVEQIAVMQSDPPGVFEASAAAAFAGAQFTPGKVRGSAVKSQMTIELFFGSPVPLADSRIVDMPR
jgi:protein TonB